VPYAHYGDLDGTWIDVLASKYLPYLGTQKFFELY